MPPDWSTPFNAVCKGGANEEIIKQEPERDVLLVINNFARLKVYIFI